MRAPLLRCGGIKLVFDILPRPPDAEFSAQLEHGAHRLLPVVRYDRKAEQRSPDLLRWSLIPCWAKDFKVGFAKINAKAEGIETRRAIRQAFERRRCLVPVDNFYEWVRREVVCVIVRRRHPAGPAVPSSVYVRALGLRSQRRHGRSLKPLNQAIPPHRRVLPGPRKTRVQMPRRARWLSG